jgi:hypothetical protein
VHRLPRDILRKRDRHRTSTKFRLGVIRWVHELCKRPTYKAPHCAVLISGIKKWEGGGSPNDMLFVGCCFGLYCSGAAGLCFQAELLDALRRRRGRGDYTSEDDEDLGLPHSPCNSPTTADVLLEQGLKVTFCHNSCSFSSGQLWSAKWPLDLTSWRNQGIDRKAQENQEALEPNGLYWKC